MRKPARDGRCASRARVNSRGTKDDSRLWSPRRGGMRRKQIPKTSGGDDVNIYEEDESKGEGRHALSALISSVGLLIPSPRGVETRAQAARRVAASIEASRPQACNTSQPEGCAMSGMEGSLSPCQSKEKHSRCIGEDVSEREEQEEPGQDCNGPSYPRDVPCTPKHQIMSQDRILEPPGAPKKTRLRHSPYEDRDGQIPGCLARQLDFDSEVSMLRSDSDETQMT